MTKIYAQGDWRIRINGGESHPLPHAHVEFRDGSRVSVAVESLQTRNIIYLARYAKKITNGVDDIFLSIFSFPFLFLIKSLNSAGKV